MEEQNEIVIVTNVYGDVCIRKARRKRQKLLIRELLFDYASNTTLHGIPYVARTGVSLIEKIFWLITFVASVSMCFFLISKVWLKWQTAPVIVTVSEQLVPVDVVPFPSITICPQSKCKVSIYNYTDNREQNKLLTLMSPENVTINATMTKQLSMFDGLAQICGGYYYPSEMLPRKLDSSVVQFMRDVAPKYYDVFLMCYFRGKYISCEDYFDEVVTSEGICYNMNSLAAKEIFRTRNLQRDYKYLHAAKPSHGWSMEHGYNNNISHHDFYPISGAEMGAAPDVDILLKNIVEERDESCNTYNSGFKVYVQHAADLPQSSLYYYAVIDDQVTNMALSFSVLNTSESLRGYDPEIRQCYFPEERYLKYFSIYTANNCRIECLSNITYKTCGCVGFYMPHESSKRICTTANADCSMKARDVMQHQESVWGKPICNCLPSCNSVEYEAEILKSNYNQKQMYNFFSQWNYTGIKFSKLEMYFKKPRFLSLRRSELFGVIDFLANIGGLLGLFLGFSFLSLMEIFYFLTLRLCCTLKKDLEGEKTQNEAEQGQVTHVDKY